jgi:hypothetical protein
MPGGGNGMRATYKSAISPLAANADKDDSNSRGAWVEAQDIVTVGVVIGEGIKSRLTSSQSPSMMPIGHRWLRNSRGKSDNDDERYNYNYLWQNYGTMPDGRVVNTK